MQRKTSRIPRDPRDPRDKITPYPTISIVRPREPGLSGRTIALIVGALVVIFVGGRMFIMTPDPEPPRRSPPRRVTTPAATEAPAPPAPAPSTPAPSATAPAKKPADDEARPQPRGLAVADAQRLRDADLEDADRFEKAHRYQEALDAIDDAIQNGADKSKLEGTRVRLKALADLARKVEDAFADSERALGTGDYEAATRALRRVTDEARQAERSSELEERLARITVARERSAKLQKCATAVQDALSALERSDLAGARDAIDRARALVPESPELARAERRLHDMERLPKGFVYVALGDDRALYVRKTPVSNAEFKKWIDDTGRAGAAPWKNGYPSSEPDAPVRGVFLDAAKNFAVSHGERLPADDEWPAVKKALHIDEVRPTAGVFSNGFYTVKNP